MPSRERKEQYFARLYALLEKYSQLFIVHADHVGSKQFQTIRYQLRGTAEVIMGKNTLIRKVISKFLDKKKKQTGKEHPYTALLPLVKGNIGFIFVDKDIDKVREVIDENIVPAPARAGIVANKDVIVPAGPTGCDPNQTSYFQAMEIPTKISKGQIDIQNDVPLIKTGQRVTAGAASLLNKLNIRPFSFGLIITHIYNNGTVFDPKVLDLKPAALVAKFKAGVNNLAALSLAIGHPTLASVPHMLSKAMQRMIAVVAEAGGEYSFPKAEATLAYLKDPSAFAAAAAAGNDEENKEEEKKEEEEEEEEVAIGGLMDGGDDEDW